MGIGVNTAQRSNAAASIAASSAARSIENLRETDAASLSPNDLQRLSQEPMTKPPSWPNRVLVFDIDGTIGGRLKADEAEIARKNGNQVFEMGRDENGLPDDYPYYTVRPGAQALLANLKKQGFILVASTRNFSHHAHHILRTFDMEKYFSDVLLRDDINSTKRPEEKDFTKYKHHSNNIGAWARFKTFLYKCTFGLVKNMMRWLKSCFNKNVRYYWEDYAPTNKYPPRMGSHVLFDNAEENTVHAKRSTDWYHHHVIRFNGVKPEPKDADGQYTWVNKVLATTNTLRDPNRGWQALVRDNYKVEPPKDYKVEVMDKLRNKLFKPGEYEEYMKVA